MDRACPGQFGGGRNGKRRGEMDGRAERREERNPARACCRTIKTAKSGRAEAGCRFIFRPTIERPQCKPNRFFMKCLRFLTVATLLALAWRPALAADATFPPGLRV